MWQGVCHLNGMECNSVLLCHWGNIRDNFWPKEKYKTLGSVPCSCQPPTQTRRPPHNTWIAVALLWPIIYWRSNICEFWLPPIPGGAIFQTSSHGSGFKGRAVLCAKAAVGRAGLPTAGSSARRCHQHEGDLGHHLLPDPALVFDEEGKVPLRSACRKKRLLPLLTYERRVCLTAEVVAPRFFYRRQRWGFFCCRAWLPLHREIRYLGVEQHVNKGSDTQHVSRLVVTLKAKGQINPDYLTFSIGSDPREGQCLWMSWGATESLDCINSFPCLKPQGKHRVGLTWTGFDRYLHQDPLKCIYIWFRGFLCTATVA